MDGSGETRTETDRDGDGDGDRDRDRDGHVDKDKDGDKDGDHALFLRRGRQGWKTMSLVNWDTAPAIQKHKNNFPSLQELTYWLSQKVPIPIDFNVCYNCIT